MTPLLFFVAVLLLIVFVALRLSPPADSVSRETLLSKTFSHILEGRSSEVLGDMRALYQKTGQDVGIGMALGILLRHLGKNQIAIRTHRSLATRRELEPDFLALIHVELAADFLACGLLDRARESVEKALELCPADEQATAYAERIYIRLETWDQAFKVVTAYGKKHGIDVRERLGLLRYRQGEACWKQTNYEAANNAYKKAVAVHETCFPAWLGQSRYFRQIEKPNKALALLKKNAAHFAGHEWLMIEEMMHLARTCNDDSVFLRAAEDRLRQDHSDWRTRRLLAWFLGEIGESEKAAEHLLSCLEDRPQVLLLHQRMWSLLLRMNQPGEVFRRYQAQVKEGMVFDHAWECKSCFYLSPEPCWSCPSCHRAYSFAERKI